MFIRIYDSWPVETQLLTDQEKGRLIDLLIAYLVTGEDQQPDGNEKFLYPLFVQRIRQEQETHERRKGNNDRSGIQKSGRRE